MKADPAASRESDLSPEDCFERWSDAVDTGDPEDILAVIHVAKHDAERSEPRARNWMKGVQILRDTGAIDENAATYLLTMVLDDMMVPFTADDPELATINEELRRIEVAHGLAEDESFRIDDAPPEWLALNARWDRRFNAICASILRSIGEDEMARMLILFPQELEDRELRGREALLGNYT